MPVFTRLSHICGEIKVDPVEGNVPDKKSSFVRGGFGNLIKNRGGFMLAFLCYLVVAAVCALLAERSVPGSIPGGFLVTALVGIIGGYVGSSMFGQFGPIMAGVALIPCILGSALLVFGLSFVSRGFRRGKTFN